MASLREYRKKIKTIKSTQQITKAMKMVAAARLRKAQSRIISARPFAWKMRDLLMDLSGKLGTVPLGTVPNFPHPLLQTNKSNKIAILMVTADKGLCGSFNTNIVRKTLEVIQEKKEKEILFLAVGRKGRDFFKRSNYPITNEYVNIFNQLSYTHAEIIGQDLIKLYLDKKLSEVLVVYNEFKTVMQQKLTVERLLPIGKLGTVPLGTVPNFQDNVDFIYEPPREKLLDALLPRYIKSQIFRILLESFAAELGARMSAMDSATKNAKELIDLLVLKLNRTRQAMITREIAELVGGAEALK